MMLKRIHIALTVMIMVTWIPTGVFAQDEDSSPSELHLFRGGYMDLNFSLGVNTVGSSMGSGGMGGLVTSRVGNGALNVNLNPALLGFMNQGQILYDSRLGVGSSITPGINSFIKGEVNDQLETAINDEFANEDSWQKFPETYIQATEVRDLDVGFDNEVSSIAFAAPITPRLSIAGAYTYPATINFDLGVTGLAAKLAQEQGTEEVAIRFDVLMNVSLLTKMTFKMNTLSAGFGYSIIDTETKKLAIGGTLTRYHVDNTRKLEADLSGMVVVGGADERYFNNPDDPNLNFDAGESNAFFMNAYGEFEASAYGFKAGLNYQPITWLNLSAVYDHMPRFNLKGNDKVAETYLPIFLVGTGKEILGGNIEVSLDSLQANKPNLTTERDISNIVEDGVLTIPSSARIGVDLFMGRHTMVLNYTKYFDSFSFEYGDNTIGKDAQHGIGLGFDFKMKDKFNSWWQFLEIPVRILYLDIDGVLFQSLGRFTKYSDSHYRFGTNILLGDGLVTTGNESLKSTLDLPLPQSFSMGRQYSIFDNIDVGVTVLAVPDLVLKYSVGIRF